MRTRVSIWSILLYYTMLLGSFGFLAWCVTQPVKAHEWYPQECCGGQDCGDATVTPLENGKLLVTTQHGAVEVSREYKWRPSPDGRAHACIIKTGYGDALQCLWLPTGV